MATRTDYESKNKPIPGGKDVPTNQDIINKLTNACRCYSAWAPSVGSYAVGYHSVANQFEKLLQNPFHYVHLPNV